MESKYIQHHMKSKIDELFKIYGHEDLNKMKSSRKDPI